MNYFELVLTQMHVVQSFTYLQACKKVHSRNVI